MYNGVRGYFEFINTSRYANLKGVSNPYRYLELIKADGYATSSGYVSTCSEVLSKYVLPYIQNEKTEYNVEEIAREVIAGKWGNGRVRKEKLEAAGYNYKIIQKAVNELLRG